MKSDVRRRSPVSTKSGARPPYDAWLLWHVPDICNLACTYCPLGDPDHVASLKAGVSGSAAKLGARRIAALLRNSVRFGVSDAMVLYQRQSLRRPDKMPPIDIPGLLKALESTGKIFRVTFSGGGEPFLVPNLVEASVALVKKHYLSFNTNLTSPRIRQLAERVDPARVLIHASFHTRELERKKLLRRYIENFVICRERGFEIYAQEVAHPELLSDVESYRKLLQAEGIVLTFGPFKGEYMGRSYPDSYTDEEIQIFNLAKKSAKGAQFNQKGALCNAGYNVAVAGPDGLINPCYDIRENLGNMFGTIKLRPEVRRCPVDVCSCPLNFYDEPLFELALAERGQDLETASVTA
jgi:MoaA/NifB/PqqE/SkfB family radical SAM enzyme